MILLRTYRSESASHARLHVASFLLGSGGLRDLMGFPKLTSLSFLGALVVGGLWKSCQQFS